MTDEVQALAAYHHIYIWEIFLGYLKKVSELRQKDVFGCWWTG
jgi:hypothetical protein